MSGLNIKVTAFMLFSIIAVHGKIYQEDRYLRDATHVESYHRSYSDNDRSDIFDDSDSKLHFDVPHPEIEDHKEGLPNSPGSVEDNNWRNTVNGIIEDLDVGGGLPNQEDVPNFVDPGHFNFDILRGLPNVFPVDNGRDQDQLRPDWMPNNVNNNGRPSWFPGGNTEGRNNYPISKPGRGEMKRKCQNMKGLPTPESGCCGVQMTRPIVYPNKPWWPQYPGGRFTRSADNEILPSQMIRGGKATDLHQFPWMVLLSIDTTVSGIGTPKSCGGTIISSRYVLTAAHCLYGTFKNLNQITVILAEYDSDTYPKDCNRQGCIMNKKMKVEHVTMHPDFKKEYLQNDVALLRLSSNINYSDYIRPICLATEDVADQSEEPLIIAGWGLNGRTESNVKRCANVNYVSNDTCKDAYSYKDDSMFCSIGGNGEDICHGDSGGPLMVYSDGKFFLSGIVSGKRGDEACGSTVPSLFNNVFYHLNWIKRHVQ
ncbi:CLIP domain-containing serine protease B4-like [Choristoneura fumiferana]|uniref:CLIP domain-containing serine protease B4-like n=1 Tax=Choristoneura fumiferana TaxID=7141 RepID=UPI003D15615E